MTRKFLNALAADLRIERRNIAADSADGDRLAALTAFDNAVNTVITGLKRANPRVDRDRFWDAVLAA
jgi:hypothetical protein